MTPSLLFTPKLTGFAQKCDKNGKNRVPPRIPSDKCAENARRALRDGGRELEELRLRANFLRFWGCPSNASEGQRTDSSAAPDAEFDGNRWNDLHYTAVAKQAARVRLDSSGEMETDTIDSPGVERPSLLTLVDRREDDD